MDYLNRLINQLDRRFELFNNAPSSLDIFLEGLRLAKWMYSEPFLHPYSREMVNNTNRAIDEFTENSKSLIEKSEKLMFQIIKIDQNLDDREKSFDENSILNVEYKFSFQKLQNLIIDPSHQNIFIPSKILLRFADQSQIGEIIKILRNKISLLGKSVKLNDESKENISFVLSEIENIHDFNIKKLFSLRYNTSGYNLAWWLMTEYAINPPPVTNAKQSLDFQRVLGQPIFSNEQITSIKNAIYDDGSQEIFGDKSYQISDADCRFSLRRVYEELRALIGTTQSYRELIGRYKARAMWFDKERLNTLPKPGKKEAPLVLDLAKWLFDQGLPVLVEPRFDNERLDLLGIKVPIIIEGKAYEATTDDILKNLAQLHSYLTMLDSTDLHITEGFYVVFRLSGPMYQFEDEVIDTGRYRIFPFVINLGDGGRKISKVITISKKEVIEAFDTTSETTDSENSVTDS